ncbi:hypothetical protein VTO42DRAFT_1637 [Malbranchea cinnamomea]
MAYPDRDLGRSTPRTSPSSTDPHAALQQLVQTIKVPTTPGDNNAAFRSRRLSRRSPAAPTTPHGLRAFQRRQSVYTPGRDRRRSGRIQRETPIDILRNLGKALAPTTRPISSSPEEAPEPQRNEIDELDQEPDIPRPRLSLPLEELEPRNAGHDSSPDIPPPRLSLLAEDEDVTLRSIEMPRRERTARELARLSRRSFISTRFSDHFGDLSRMEETTERVDETITQDMGEEEEEQLDMSLGQQAFDAGGETEDLRRFNLEFSFPTPEAPVELPADNQVGNDFEDFVLDAVGPNIDAASPSSISDAGGVGFEMAMPNEQPHRSPSPLVEEFQDKGVAGQGKETKLSRHGVPVPSLPSGIVRKLATRFARTGHGSNTRIPKKTLAALEQATEWFFEQASEDIAAYSKHAGRKTIDESDLIALMRRQRHIGKGSSIFSIAQRHLPKELLQNIRLPRR